MKRKIIFANQATGYLTLDIVNAFAASGMFDKVKLFTGEINIRPTKPHVLVDIIKTKKYDKKNLISRFFSWLVAFVHLICYAALKSNRYNLFLVSNPPLNIFMPYFTGKKYSLLIYDVYPDTLISQNVMREDSWLVKCWTKANKKSLRKAEHVFTISNDMRKALAKYVDKEKIQVIYNWGHNDHIKPLVKAQNIFLHQNQLMEKFVVLYSGNIGITHDIDKLIDVAKLLRSDDRFRFVIIGEGGKKPVIESKIKEFELNNCMVLPFQPLEVLPFSIGAADVAVVTTDAKQTGLSIPSKVYSYLSTGAAFMCIADRESELGKLTETEKIGKCFLSSEISEMARYLTQLADDSNLLNQYKANAREVSFRYTPSNAFEYLKAYIAKK